MEGEQPVGDAKKMKDRNIKYVNNRSLVTMFTCGEIKYLNCGDIEYEVEKKILDKKIDIKADIFKLNHHAGNTSNAGPFQKAVNAKYVYHTNRLAKRLPDPMFMRPGSMAILHLQSTKDRLQSIRRGIIRM